MFLFFADFFGEPKLMSSGQQFKVVLLSTGRGGGISTVYNFDPIYYFHNCFKDYDFNFF